MWPFVSRKSSGKDRAIGVINMKNKIVAVAASLAIMAAMIGVAAAARTRNGTNLSEKGGLRS
jgi:hypothetical protein